MAKTLFVVSINDDVGLEFQGAIRERSSDLPIRCQGQLAQVVRAILVGSGLPSLPASGWQHRQNPSFRVSRLAERGNVSASKSFLSWIPRKILRSGNGLRVRRPGGDRFNTPWRLAHLAF
jgi:hypothetical protein